MGIKSSKRLGNSLIKISLAAQLIGLTSSGLHAAGGDTLTGNKPSGALPSTAAATPAEGSQSVGVNNVEVRDAETEQLYQSSRDLLSDLMGNRILHDIYRNAQLEALTHPVDRALRKFFLADPTSPLAQIYDVVSGSMKMSLRQFQLNAEASMKRLRAGDPDERLSKDDPRRKINRLLDIVKDVARDLGFSREAIAKISVYMNQDGGNLNAFTVSGSQDNIIVVLNTALINSMDELELRAVLGHEMGHIRASHPVNGYLLDIMFTLVYRTFTTGSIAAAASNETDLHIFSKKCVPQKSENGDVAKVVGGSKTFLPVFPSNNIDESKLNGINSLTDLTTNIVNVMLNIPEVQRRNLLLNFMNFANDTLREMNVASDTIEYFKELTEKLHKGSVIQVSSEQMKAHLQVLDQAISRAQEISADHFGSSISKNFYLATSMAKLLGILFNKEGRMREIQEILLQAEELRAEATPEEWANLMRGSHPAAILRTHMIMNFSTTPDIFFANPMMALLILQQGLEQERKGILSYLRSQSTQEMGAVPAGKQEALRQRLKDTAASLAKSQEEVEAKIVRHLMVVEGTRKDIQGNAVGSKRNPRFENTMQLILFQKEALVEKKKTLVEIRTGLDAKLYSDAINEINFEIEAIDEALATHGKSILTKIKEAMSAMAQNSETTPEKRESLNKRIEQIDLALTMPDGIDGLTALQALRAELTELPRIRNKGSRIPRPEISRGFSAAACLKSLAGGQ